MCLFLAVLSLHCCAGFSLVAGVRATLQVQCVALHYSLQWLLLLRGLQRTQLEQFPTAGSLVVILRLQSTSSTVSCSTGSIVVTQGLKLLHDMQDLPGPEMDLCYLHWQVNSLPLKPPEKPLEFTFLPYAPHWQRQRHKRQGQALVENACSRSREEKRSLELSPPSPGPLPSSLHCWRRTVTREAQQMCLLPSFSVLKTCDCATAGGRRRETLEPGRCGKVKILYFGS